MKLKLCLAIVVAALLFSACTRSVTPYEAANGKRHTGKCLRIR